MKNSRFELKIKRYTLKFIISLFIFFLVTNCFSQENEIIIHQSLKWNINESPQKPMNNAAFSLNFENAVLNESKGFLPEFHIVKELDDENQVSVRLENTQYQAVDIPVNKRMYLFDCIVIDAEVKTQSDKNFADISFLPIRKNYEKGTYEILTDFDLIIIPSKVTKTEKFLRSADNWSTGSVLAEGQWNKIEVSESGVYMLDYNFLASMDYSMNTIDPRKIHIYGNGGGMLPMKNTGPVADDLSELAIYVSGAEDGRFDNSDYILFYAQGPHTWTYDPATIRFLHHYNYYSDKAFYFVTINNEDGKRITTQPTLGETPDHISSQYDFYAFHEKHLFTDVVDYVKSGRDWLGEEFGYTNSRNFTFKISNIDISKPVKITSVVAARSALMSFFQVSSGTQTETQSVSSANVSYYLADYCHYNKKSFEMNAENENFQLTYNYDKTTSDSKGWLDYIEINARCNLVYSNNQLSFRDHISKNIINKYEVKSASPQLTIWDVTDLHNAKVQEKNQVSDGFEFEINKNSIAEFVAFNISDVKKPINNGKIPNQNLHGIEYADMVIVSHPDFLQQAERLAEFHRNKQSLSVVVCTPGQIYNEFSSGSQDIAAIRNFMQMLYEKPSDTTKRIKYLLLFGDASYDYKDVIEGNTNFVPTYQSLECYSPEGSYASDDFFGCLNNDEGDFDNAASYTDLLDIAIGRFPVDNPEQAKAVVDKILNYAGTNSFGDWRNRVLFVADDPDDSGWNGHFLQSESVSNYLDQNYNEFTLQKVNLDAFKQITSPNGMKYPDAQAAITNKINSGVLVINYIGHGGEAGWAHERVVEVSDIRGWSNFNSLPLFVTATCEFTRFDDPERISAGEWVFLNPNGGGVALLTSSRVVYSGSNDQFVNNLYHDNIFERIDGEYKTLGDIIKKAKNSTKLYDNTRKFLLIGDPALMLACPYYNVVTTSHPDTLKAFSKVTFTGEVQDKNGNRVNDFNGIVIPTVYDKMSIEKTLANDPNSEVVSFLLRKNIIYKGQASVVNGEFSFSFIVPKDISYANGFGKISYYVNNQLIDGNGSSIDLVIGGTSDSLIQDTTCPKIQLFINDTNFVSGGITGENSILLAELFDKNGINTTGNGVGHEIIAQIDDGEPIIVNDYYQSKLDDFRRGEIRYPMKNLSEGLHTARVKVWDIANNSAEATVEFRVVKSDALVIQKLFVFPNPVTQYATFSFEHNRPGQNLNIILQIFNLQGECIKTENLKTFSEGSRFTGLHWNLASDFGTNAEDGLYVYKILITDSDGISAQASGKLIISY